jgi:hypothetical protein
LLTIDKEMETKAQSIACLRHLAYDVDNRFRMLETQLFDPLAAVAAETQEDIEILRELSALSTQLTLTD